MAERRLRAAFKTAMRGWGWAPWWLPVCGGVAPGRPGWTTLPDRCLRCGRCGHLAGRQVAGAAGLLEPCW
eukprot:14509903-Alexandrium_andersonii.AAC.1